VRPLDRLHDVVTGTTSSRNIGVYRVLLGLALLAEGLNRFGKYADVLNPKYVALPYFDWWPRLPYDWAWTVIAAWCVCAALFTVGWHTRVSGTLLSGLLIFYMFTDHQLFTNHTYLFILLAVLTTFADSGAYFSLDARRNGRRDRVPAWPVFLLMAQLSVAYFFAFVSKFNTYYLEGGVLWRNANFVGPIPLPDSIKVKPLLIAMAVGGMLIEGAVSIGIWNPRFRRPLFTAGLLFHLGIWLTMRPVIGLAVFAFETLSIYILFVVAPPRSMTVVWDDTCRFCSSWVRWWRRFDWLGALRFVPASDAGVLAELGISRADALARIQLVDRDGTRASGFSAVRRVLDVLPVSFLWAPLLELPPVQRLGDRLYDRTAARRSCAVVAADRRDPAAAPMAPVPTAPDA
jgi:predicted DCC family thiol-disulfide oxidoreductase YuxK/uncharacterized membrane protein YphA (DoxX/SURF4 family)